MNLLKSKSILFLFCVIFSQLASAQYKYEKSIQFVKGKYYPKAKSFFAQIVDENDPHFTHQYKAVEFNGKVSPVKHSSTNNASYNKLDLGAGIIDTLGNLLIPCIYDEIEWISYTKADQSEFIFVAIQEDKTLLVSSENEVLHSMPKRGNGRNYFRASHDLQTDHLNFVNICLNGQFGLLSISQKKEILKPQFDEITIYNNIAICKKGNLMVAFNCLNATYSENQRQIFKRKNGDFLVLTKENKWVLVNDVFNLSAGLAQKTEFEVIENQNDVLIVKAENGKFGLLDRSDKFTISPSYENIYFFGKKLLLVKQKGLWAISTYQGRLLSKFQFKNVEKQNITNLDNFIKYTQTDTSDLALAAKIKKHSNPLVVIPRSYEVLCVQMLTGIGKIKHELNQHRLSEYAVFVLQKEYGYSPVKISEDDTTFTIYPDVYDAIYPLPKMRSVMFSPDNTIGVRKGNTYGFVNLSHPFEAEIKHENILFEPLKESFSYIYSGSGQSIRTSPFIIVKRGNMYYTETKSFSGGRKDKTRKIKMGKYVPIA
jgi:hypothetical protein